MPGGATSRKDADGKGLSREKIVIWYWHRERGKRHTLVGLLELRLGGEVLLHVGGFLVDTVLFMLEGRSMLGSDLNNYN